MVATALVIVGSGAAPLVAKKFGADDAQTLAFSAAAIGGVLFIATGSTLAGAVAIGAGVGGGVLLMQKKAAETKKVP